MAEEREPRPVLVSIPHASSRIPDEVKDYIALSEVDLKGYTDLHTEKIFNVDDVHLVQYDVSRVVVDVNHAPDDISKEYEQASEGVIVHTTWDGKSVYTTEPSQEQVDALIERYHDPYHNQIEEVIPKVRFLLDGHSFLPVGPKLKADSGKERPDINLGNVNFSTCTREHTVFFRDFFQNKGYKVAVNFPYAGKYILGRHCHRRRIPPFLVPGIQIEINQGLYLKPDSFDAIPELIEEFKELFKRLVDDFCERFCP